MRTLLAMTAPAPDTAWFSVAEDKRHIVIVSCSVLYGLFGAVLVGFVAIGISADDSVVTTMSTVIAVVFGLAGGLHVWLLLWHIRQLNEVLGIEQRGLWWHESGRFVFFGWEELRIVQLRLYTNFEGRTDASLDLHPFQPRPSGDPIVDRLTQRNCYRLELTRTRWGWTPSLRGMQRSKVAGQIAFAMSAVRPDKFIGPG